MATQTNSTAAATPRKRRRWVKWLVVLGALVVIYTITGFFIVPAVIKSQMLKRIPALTHRQASIESVKVNPYALSLTLNGFALKDLDGGTFVGFDRVYVNFQLSSIFKRCWVFDEISVDAPFLQVAYLTNGTFNFSDLLTNLTAAAPAPVSAAPKKPSEPPPVLVYHLIITNGAVAFTDQTRDTPFKTRFQPIDVDLSGLTTIHDADSPYFFSVRSDTGESFAWKGRVTVNPLHADGSFRLDGFRLPKYMPYSRDFARLEIVDGQIGVSADYRYDSATNMLDLSVSKASVELSKLRIKTPDTGEEVISIPSLSVQGIDAALARMTAHVALVKSSGGAIQVRRNADGGIDLLSYLVPPAKSKQAARTAPSAAPAAFPPLSVKVDEVAFDNYSVKAEDRVPPKPALINLDQIAFDVKGIALPATAPVTLSAGLRIQETGTVGVNGSATLMPPSADLQIGVTNLDLRIGQPYVEQQAKVAITHGALNVNGHARYPGGEGGSPMATFEGDVSVADFACADEIQFKDLAHWKDLSIDGIKLAVQPDKVQVNQIKLSGFGANLILDTNRQPVILAVLPKKTAGSAPSNEVVAASTAPAKTVPDISVGAVVLENASVGFADQSIEPHCTFTIQDFSGTIKDLSSKDQTTASVEVKGNVDAQSPFTVSGRVNPLASKLFADIAVTFTNTSLISFTPYTEKFAGRPLQKGKFSFGVHYLVNDKDLKAENGFFVDQLTLGAKNDSPDATHLPVKLAIALLKDRSGRIKLDVPVQGRIDDPKFSIVPIIWQVIENLMIKAAASPFTLLGSMFGGGEEMSFVDFDPGQSIIPAGETNKLEKLSKALYERPEVTVEITGSVDPSRDRDILAHAKFEQRLKAVFIKELTDAGKPASNIDEVKLDPADYSRLTFQAYTNDFGPFTNSVLTTNSIATNAIVSAPARKSAVVVSKPPSASSPAPPDIQHGAAQLVALAHPFKQVVIHTKYLPHAATNSIPEASTPAAPPGPDDIASMEQKLIEKVVVTDDDLRQLMQDRAAQVQGYLLKSGKVTAERLFLIAPRPMTAGSKGEDKVNLSLN